MYSREIDGRVYTFGVSGKLLRNVLVLFDRETGSLWSQLLSEAVEGELTGTKLSPLPSWFMTWQEWKMRYPETLALVKGTEDNPEGGDGDVEGLQAGVPGAGRVDDGLLARQFVTGVELDGEAVAYPWSVLSREPVVNDQMGDTPVLVVFDAGAATGVAFRRRVEGQTLTFSLSDPETLILTDVETGSRWAGLTGQALEGPLAGRQLERVESTEGFWSDWNDSYPETRVYGQGGE